MGGARGHHVQRNTAASELFTLSTVCEAKILASEAESELGQQRPAWKRSVRVMERGACMRVWGQGTEGIASSVPAHRRAAVVKNICYTSK